MTKANTPSSSSSFSESSTEQVDTSVTSRRRSGHPARGTSGWVIAPTPVAAWVTGPLQTCYRGGHKPVFGEPPCAWRWPARLWTTILTSYSRPGDRVLITDAGNGIAVRTGIAMDRRITARVPSRYTRADLHLELLEEHSQDTQRQTVLFDDRPRHPWQEPTLRPSTAAGPGREAGAATQEQSEGQWPQQPVDLIIIAPPCPANEPSTSQDTYRSPAEVDTETSRVDAGDGLDESGSDGDPEGEFGPQDAVLATQVRLLTERAALVRAGGLIVVLTRITPDRDGAIDRLGPLIEHARGLGLRYLQHVPVLHAELRHGRFSAGFGPDDPAWSLIGRDSVSPAYWQEQPSQGPASLPYVGPVDEPHLHMPIHSDLVVFQVSERPDRPQHELEGEDNLDVQDGQDGIEGRDGAGAK